MKKTLTCCLSAWLILNVTAIHATNYYFSSSNGNDSYTSTQAQNPATPWQSISKLNSFSSSLRPGDSVFFKCGDTFYGKVVISKSGTSGSPIVFSSYGTGASPIISGFSSVTSWTNVGTNLWESTNAVTSSSNMLNMVTINGSFQPIGRWPKFTSANQGYLNTDSHSGNSSITSSGLSGAPDFSGGQIVTRKNHWVIDVDNISSNSGSTVYFSDSDPDYGVQKNWGFFIQNHRNACTQQGDWYYNTSSKKIGMYSSGTPSGVMISNIDVLMDLSNSSYLTFLNLTFSGSNTTTLFLNLSQYITFDKCTVSYAGQNAVVMTEAGLDQSKTKNITISNSTISYVNNNGIVLSKSQNCAITNSSLKNIGMVAGMGQNSDGQYIGVLKMGGNSTFSNNILDSIGYTGFWFTGQNITVRNNSFSNFCMTKDDGAGIYTYGTDNSGTVVSGNIVLNAIGSPYGTNNGSNYAEGIYMDDETSNVTISGNTIANCSSRGIYIHNAHEITISNNISFNNKRQVEFSHDDIAPSDPIRNVTMSKNQFVSKTSTQTVWNFNSISDDILNFGNADNNYYSRPINEPTTLSIPGTDNTLAGWQSYSGQDGNSKKSPKTITDVNDIRFEYNASLSPKVVNLGATYISIDGTSYSGTMTLAPYTSKVLIYLSGVVSNQPPVANAGADQNFFLPTNSVTLNGSGSDPDGSIASYQWSKISGPSQFTIVSPTQAQTVINNLIQGTYQFVLTVTDNLGAIGKDTVTVTVNANPNQSPTANAGTNQNITLPTNNVTLSGSGSDPDGSIASYQWSKISGPSQFTIVSPTQAQTVINNLIQGTYQFALTVTDNLGAIGKDTVTVTVNANPNQSPTANAGTNQNITLPTNNVTLSGSGSDPDGSITSYQWTKIAGPSQFTIVSPTQAQTVINNLVQGTYQFVLTVTDNLGATGKDTIIVTVNAAPNQAPNANAGVNQNITLPTNSVTLTGSGTDPDGTIASYQWRKISGPNSGNITNVNAVSTTVTGLIQGVYQYELRVTDNNGAYGRDTIQVTVNPANIAPTANAGPNYNLTLPTNSATITGSGTDPDGTISSYQWSYVSGPTQYNIVSPSQAQTIINNLVQGTYQFQLTVTDNQGATGTDIVIISVNSNVNQPPVANAGANQNITLPTNSVTLSGSGSDADGTITSYAWTKISGPTQFTIVSPSQAQTVINNLVQGTYQFQLTVTDNQGSTGVDLVSIVVNPAPNQPPVANAGLNQNITLPTNSVTLVGSGSDPDGTIASYQWSKTSGPSQFTIVSSTQAQTAINNLVEGVYQFKLAVTDNQGATGVAFVTVTVNAAPNQAPSANAGPNQNITLPTNSITLSGSGSDPDGTISSYSWTKISGPSQFNIVSPTQAQTIINNLIQGVYQFQLKVTDNRGATGTANVTVTVNAAPNQSPTANAGTDQTITLPTNSVSLSGSGNDPDGTIASYSWSRIAGPTQFTIVSPTQAKTSVNNLVQGVYVFQLTVTDNSGASATDIVSITVNAAPVSPAPTANAGNDQVIVLPQNSTTLSGSGNAPNGSITSYSWSQLSGPAISSIASASQSQTSVQNLVAGIYQFVLVVTDNNGKSGKDTVQVTVENSPNRNQVSPTIKLYPNPVSDILNIEIDAATHSSPCYIKIYSASGNLVYQEEFVRDQYTIIKQINVSTLAKGIYFVKISGDVNTKSSLKFVKQ